MSFIAVTVAVVAVSMNAAVADDADGGDASSDAVLVYLAVSCCCEW